MTERRGIMEKLVALAKGEVAADILEDLGGSKPLIVLSTRVGNLQSTR